MITVSDLVLRVGGRTLVENASFRIDDGAKIGLVGRNGAGKTTMMRFLAGRLDQLEFIEATAQISRGKSVGYLPQDPGEVNTKLSAHAHILSVRGIDSLLTLIEKAEHDMSTLTGEAQQKAMDRYVRLDHEFTMNGGWAAASQAAQIAAGLGIDKHVLKQKLGTLSGGQRRRIELARVLFSQATTLLLDEPTNHLDHDSILWLRDYLRSFGGGVLIISHDVKLLQDTVNRVMFLDANRGALDVYQLGWKDYLQARQEDEKRRRKERLNAQKKAAALQAQGEKLRAKATKAVAAQQMLRRAKELLENTQDNEVTEKIAKLRFPSPAPCGKVPLQAEDLSKSYGSNEVFAGLDIAIDRGSRVVVLGFNGAGKTTFLKLLAGIEQPNTGKIIRGHGLKMAYYAQEHETLDMTLSVYDNMVQAAPDFDETQVRSVLGQFLFSGQDVFKPAQVLSGGERTRLVLSTMVVSKANVLLLDEPTNNLDPASKNEILKSLAQYEGAVVMVSHDPQAVRALEPDRVLLLPDGDEDHWSEEYMDFVELV